VSTPACHRCGVDIATPGYCMSCAFTSHDRGDVSWMDRGSCREVGDLVLWFPEAEKGWKATEAKAICNGRDATKRGQLAIPPCAVRDVCLAYALEHNEVGVWAGTSDRERMQMRAERKAA